MIRENSFELVYTDLHIHTSEKPDKIKDGVIYDLDELIHNIDNISENSKKLISFTDHNTINKEIYSQKFPDLYHLILGVELHISYNNTKKPYHCHMYFNIDNIPANIDKINILLDKLYPKKEITDKDYKNIPTLEKIINEFVDYDFILLPHGGQNHSRFNDAMPKNATFDNIMEKVLYYNQFDGFTSRTTRGITATENYFKKLGINEFTNLITCSDNYNPKKYPDSKGKSTEKFIPTWIMAEPTFDGLRLALSESGRLRYSEKLPTIYEDYIKGYKIKNDKLDIDVDFKQGLNVIIGESSSGKSLLVDSLVKKIKPAQAKNNYDKFDFSTLKVDNPTGFTPYYINQSYITEVARKNKIEDIAILKKMFGSLDKTKEKTMEELNKLEKLLTNLFNSVEKIKSYSDSLLALPNLETLILGKNSKTDPLDNLFPNIDIIDKIEYDENEYEKHQNNLDDILKFSKNNIYVENIQEEIEAIKEKLCKAYEKSTFERYIRKILKKNQQYFNMNYKYTDHEVETKTKNFESALLLISKYLEETNKFYNTLNLLIKFSYFVKSKPKKICNHQLYVENKLTITKDTICECINNYLKSDYKIKDISNLKPSDMYLEKVNGNYSISDYNSFKKKIYTKIVSENNDTYKIITSDNKNWEELSPGWKTAILVELILDYNEDSAPLIIDQPEDNLANKYINEKLIKDLKKAKVRKQIIIVSHNATIPILADAENIIFCKSEGDKLIIKSNYLEGQIDGKKCLDIIATITDGGKRSIKKRFKKYNIKTYKEDINEV